MESPKIRRALISVSDKMGLAGFARSLVDAGIEIYSTGGTAKHLQQEGMPVHEVSEYTGFPEMMHGRLKTLHPKVFGGILARLDQSEDRDALTEHGIEFFELVVVNLYPFEATVSREGVTLEQAIEQIDIGGPSLVRAAAKNHAFVTVATRPDQYPGILTEIEQHGATTVSTRRRLATEAFQHTAAYDRAIADYFTNQGTEDTFSGSMNQLLHRKAVLRYGENPHQAAALYQQTATGGGANLVAARKLNGKELSYNNLMDLDAALAIVRSLPGTAAAVIKHSNPCGAASASDLAQATQRALDGDPTSAFGSVLGFNQTVDVPTAEILATPGLFIEAIVAPYFEEGAVEILTTRPKWKKNVRLMEVGPLETPPDSTHYRCIDGGMLVQQADVGPDDEENWEVVTEAQPTEQQWQDLRFAWAVVRHVKSNAIVVCRDAMLCGAGAGQMSRVDSVDIAIRKAGERVQGCVLGSDAFFPFPDSIQKAAAAGISAVIQPGGSRRDDDVKQACNELGIAMVFTHRRHFKH